MKSSEICFLKFEKLKYFKIVKSSKIKVPGTILKKYHITRLAANNCTVFYTYKIILEEQPKMSDLKNIRFDHLGPFLKIKNLASF
jgi:hypothetical protein